MKVMTCPSASGPQLLRAYGDIDFAARSGDRDQIISRMEALGYQADAQLNALHGRSRLWFYHQDPDWKIDVFLDRIEMCHALDIKDRFTPGSLTLPIADLLLLKTQIVETTEKDLRDAVALLLDHPPQVGGELDPEYFAQILASDWGWWRTSTMVLERISAFAQGEQGIDAGRIEAAIETLTEQVEAQPKGLRWKARARIGDRAAWYELPEET